MRVFCADIKIQDIHESNFIAHNTHQTMATLKVREQINQLIRFTALGMLVLGILVTIAPFKIHYHNNQIYFSKGEYEWQTKRKYCLINIEKTYDQYWSGFTVCIIYNFYTDAAIPRRIFAQVLVTSHSYI